MDIQIKRVTASAEHLEIYQNLLQWYEAEFSFITKKKPNKKGEFSPDTPIDDRHLGFVLELEGLPAGIANIGLKSGLKSELKNELNCAMQYEVCEFYVVPVYRLQGMGKNFMHLIWDWYPGLWEIKQIQGAEYATKFWRKTIASYHRTEFEEISVEDEYWGQVTQQSFCIEDKV